ncbi:kinase-like domain-containing protein [Xylaria arbuscula]|nr:kinase-like domain-containing protein [Xylaria arbuscula]
MASLDENFLIDDILHDQDDKKPFRDAGITDVLFPFPQDGDGLPTEFRKAEKLDSFLTKQSRHLHSGDQLEEEIWKRLTGHIRLPHSFREHGFKTSTNTNKPKGTGSGGFASVFWISFKSQDRGEEKLVAKLFSRRAWIHRKRVGIDLKAVYPSREQSSFQAELKILQSIHNAEPSDPRLLAAKKRHILELRATFTDPEHFGIILSPLASCNLAEFIADHLSHSGNFGDSGISVRSVLEQSFGCLAAAMHFLHHSGIRHNDLKPKNVLVSNDGTLLICDFGLGNDNTTHQSSSMTDEMTKGPPIHETQLYISLEWMQQKNIQYHDMFALGLIFLEIIAFLKNKSLHDIEAFLREKVETHIEVGDLDDMTDDAKSRLRGWLEGRNWDESSETDFYNGHTEYVPVRRRPCRKEELLGYLRLGSNDIHTTFIMNLLERDHRRRWTSEELANTIVNHAERNGTKLWKDCCGEIYDGRSIPSAADAKRGLGEPMWHKKVNRFQHWQYSKRMPSRHHRGTASEPPGSRRNVDLSPTTTGDHSVVIVDHVAKSSRLELWIRIIQAQYSAPRTPPRINVWLTLAEFQITYEEPLTMILEWCDDTLSGWEPRTLGVKWKRFAYNKRGDGLPITFNNKLSITFGERSDLEAFMTMFSKCFESLAPDSTQVIPISSDRTLVIQTTKDAPLTDSEGKQIDQVVWDIERKGEQYDGTHPFILGKRTLYFIPRCPTIDVFIYAPVEQLPSRLCGLKMVNYQHYDNSARENKQAMSNIRTMEAELEVSSDHSQNQSFVRTVEKNQKLSWLAELLQALTTQKVIAICRVNFKIPRRSLHTKAGIMILWEGTKGDSQWITLKRDDEHPSDELWYSGRLTRDPIKTQVESNYKEAVLTLKILHYRAGPRLELESFSPIDVSEQTVKIMFSRGDFEGEITPPTSPNGNKIKN